jgi:phospholipid-binding lipoprotein MlaA
MIAPGMLSIMMVTVIGGCSTAPAPVQPIDSMQVAASPSTPSDPESAASSQRDRVGALSSAGSNRSEFSDPFAQPGEIAAEEESDPWKPFNTAMFEFNRRVDRFVLKPVAQGYDFIVPDAAQIGVGNFFHNVRFVPRLMNNVFQLKAKGAGIELGRFLINSTVGIAGFFDPAKHWWHLETPDEDSGQTFGVYGVKQGPYLVLPFLPPLTLRDGIGYVADLAFDPINWLVFPVIEVSQIPSAVAHSNRTMSTIARFGAKVGDTVNDRSLNLERFQGVEETTVDLYAAVRNAYLQKRAQAVRE